MTVNNAVLCGSRQARHVRPARSSPTRGELQEVFLGEDNYVSVQIPPGIANGYKAYGDKMVILANCASEPHRARRDAPARPVHPGNPLRLGPQAWIAAEHERSPTLVVSADATAGQLRRRRDGPRAFYEREHGAVLSTAIDKYIWVTVKRHGEHLR